jgi:hypothetical protein
LKCGAWFGTEARSTKMFAEVKLLYLSLTAYTRINEHV